MAPTTQRRSADAGTAESHPVRMRQAAFASKDAERRRTRVADREEVEAEDAVDDSEKELEEESKQEDIETESNAQGSSRTMANADAFRLGASPADKKKQAALERSILTGSYLTQAGANASELSRRLKQTWAVLQKMPNQHQEDESVPLERLQLLCAELMHERILAHNETNVRSLAACCFVELLRVYAPDMAFKSNEELYDAFQLIIEQIRNLAIEGNDEGDKANTSCDAHYCHILESLASTKSCSLLIGVEFTVEEGEEPLLVQLFKALFDTIRKEHLAKIENLMITIMTACIEDSDMIEQPLLDVILSPLVNAGVDENEALGAQNSSLRGGVERGSYHMAQEVIRRSSDQLHSHLSHFFNSILVDAPSGLTAHKSSDLKEHVYTLIYEVHKINPSLLLYVLPNVCIQLQVDEVATRSEAIALMGRLFASSHADYGHQYMKNFRDFLGRFRDVSKEIRLQMVQVCAIIWQRKAELGSLIEKEFVLRLSDPDWEVRRLVVNELCDLAANNLEVVSEECLRQTGERMKDKKVILRKETMTGLSQVYAAHISKYWSPEDGNEEDELNRHNVPTINSKKLGWVPDFVLKCFAYPQQELRLRVVQLLDDILLPKAASEVTRAKGLLFIFQALDPASKEALRRILSERAKCLQSCREFVLAKKQQRQFSKGSSSFINDEDTAYLAAQRKNSKLKVTPAKLVQSRCSAIKVAVNVLLHCEVGYESAEVKSRIQQVTSLLFDLLRSDGRKWTSNPGLAAKYRAAASSSLLKLMRNRTIEGSVSVSEWHVLGFVMQDSSEEVRGCFIAKLTSHLMKHAVPHPHKYLSYLSLAASEPSMVLKKKARSLLMMAVERMRRMFEALLARAGSDAVSAEAESLMVPEYSLPYVIHLLAHHPDFPKEAAERSVTLNASIFHNSVWSEQLLHLSFFLDGLVSGNATQADNIAFLLQILTKMSECDDVTSPQSTHIYPLIDTAALLLKKKIKNQSNLKTFPGKIYLPKQLYAKGGSKKPLTSNLASSVENEITSESITIPYQGE
uniref:Sister chromatid cohesion protein n=1 Tax=Globisporangium ultimum (strain ATCC 200006 / CBS 805.95 / DAOM BR144) TaxID=431595 RepID=K3X0E1_GLOUD